jgi:hypothetical protein
MTIYALNRMLDAALRGDDLSASDGAVLLQQTDPGAITAIRDTADALRQQQVGDTVTYVINRNINFTNICDWTLDKIKGMNPRGKPRLVFRPKGRGMNPKRIKNPAASGLGMEEDLLPNLRFGLQSNFFAASSGESTPTRLKPCRFPALLKAWHGGPPTITSISSVELNPAFSLISVAE